MICKDFVVIELWLELLERRLKARDVLHFLLGQLLQHFEARTLVTLREDDVNTDNGDLVVVEQFVEQQRHAIARPRPASLAAFVPLGQAFVVDVENDDARIDGARHGQRQPRVINNCLEPIYQRQLESPAAESPFCGVAQKCQQQGEAQTNANDIFFQPASYAAVGMGKCAPLPLPNAVKLVSVALAADAPRAACIYRGAPAARLPHDASDWLMGRALKCRGWRNGPLAAPEQAPQSSRS